MNLTSPVSTHRINGGVAVAVQLYRGRNTIVYLCNGAELRQLLSLLKSDEELQQQTIEEYAIAMPTYPHRFAVRMRSIEWCPRFNLRT